MPLPLIPEIMLEGELGYMKGSSEIQKNVHIRPEDYTKPEQAAEYVQKTGVERLAVVFGNIHGIVTEQEEHLDIPRLEKIAAAVPETYLVLHGASGLADQEITEAIKAGITNVHFNTELRIAYQEGIKDELKREPEQTTPYKFLAQADANVQEVVEKKVRLFMSASIERMKFLIKIGLSLAGFVVVSALVVNNIPSLKANILEAINPRIRQQNLIDQLKSNLQAIDASITAGANAPTLTIDKTESVRLDQLLNDSQDLLGQLDNLNSEHSGIIDGVISKAADLITGGGTSSPSPSNSSGLISSGSGLEPLPLETSAAPQVVTVTVTVTPPPVPCE